MTAVFDGTASHLKRSVEYLGSGLDSKKGLVSTWIKRGSTGADVLYEQDSAVKGMQIQWTAGNLLQVTGYNAADSKILDISTTTAITSTTLWNQIAFSWDLGAGTTRVVVNGADDATKTTETDDTVDYTRGEASIGSTSAGGSYLDAKLYDFIFWPGQYLDLTDKAVMLKLLSTDAVDSISQVSEASVTDTRYSVATEPGERKPVGYGHDAAFPTGTRPLVYFAGGGWQSGKNKGTGGDFVLTGGYTAVTTDDIPNAYRLASKGGRVGERWFDSEKSGMSATRSETFIEKRPGHPDHGRRLRTRDERDEKTRDLVTFRRSFSRLIRPNEEDHQDRRF